MNRKSLQIFGLVVLGGAALFLSLGADEARPKAATYQTVFVPAMITPPGSPIDAPTTPDGKKLATDIDAAIKQLAGKGYEVVEIIPVTKGEYRWRNEQTVDRGGSNSAASAYGWGYGFGITSGVLIVAKKG